MKRVSLAPVLSLTVILAASCSTAPSHRIETEVHNPDWQGAPFTNILVVGLYEDRGFRISSESVFTAELSEKAVAAAPSYERIPNLGSLDNEAAIRQALEGTDFDAVLTVATVEAGPDFDYDAWQAQYGILRLLGSEGTFSLIGGSIDSYESGRFVLDVGLWDPATLKPIWNATTESYSKEDASQQVTTLADFIIETLRDRGFI